jgi:hypothetical protein
LVLVGLGGALVFQAEHNPGGGHCLSVAGKKYRAWLIIVQIDSFEGSECIDRDQGIKVKRSFERLSQARGHWFVVGK